MSNKDYGKPLTQGQVHVHYPASVRSYGATHPAFVEGDTPGQATGQYMRLRRGTSGMASPSGYSGFAGYTGVTGVYLVKTTDPFVAVVDVQATVQLSLADQGDYTVVAGPKILHENGTWTVPLIVKVGAVNTDIPSGADNQLNFTLVLRNSKLRP